MKEVQKKYKGNTKEISAIPRYFWPGHVYFTCCHHRSQDAFCLILRLGFGLVFSCVASVFHSWYVVFPAIGVAVLPLASMLLPAMRRKHVRKYLAFCLILLCFIRFLVRYYLCEYVKVMIVFSAGVSFIFHWFYKGSSFVSCKSKRTCRLDGYLIALILLDFVRVLASYSLSEYAGLSFLLVFPLFREEFPFPFQKPYMPWLSIA